MKRGRDTSSEEPPTDSPALFRHPSTALFAPIAVIDAPSETFGEYAASSAAAIAATKAFFDHFAATSSAESATATDLMANVTVAKDIAAKICAAGLAWNAAREMASSESTCSLAPPQVLSRLELSAAEQARQLVALLQQQVEASRAADQRKFQEQHRFQEQLRYHMEQQNLKLHQIRRLGHQQRRDQHEHFASTSSPAVASTLQFFEELSCGVCFRLMCRPMALRCGHSFCSSCLVQHERVAQHAACPACRAPLGRTRPNVVFHLDAAIRATRGSIAGEVLGETLEEWKQRAVDWDARASAELEEWTGRGRDAESDGEHDSGGEDAADGEPDGVEDVSEDFDEDIASAAV